MLVIRFSRTGKKNHPHYRVVLAEKTYPVQGKFIELLGSYDPHQKIAQLKEERVKHWLEKGVGCTDTVHNLLVEKGLLKAPKIKFEFKPKPNSTAAKEGDVSGSEAESGKKEDEIKSEEEKKEPPKQEEAPKQENEGGKVAQDQ